MHGPVKCIPALVGLVTISAEYNYQSHKNDCINHLRTMMTRDFAGPTFLHFHLFAGWRQNLNHSFNGSVQVQRSGIGGYNRWNLFSKNFKRFEKKFAVFQMNRPFALLSRPTQTSATCRKSLRIKTSPKDYGTFSHFPNGIVWNYTFSYTRTK